MESEKKLPVRVPFHRRSTQVRYKLRNTMPGRTAIATGGARSFPPLPRRRNGQNVFTDFAQISVICFRNSLVLPETSISCDAFRFAGYSCLWRIFLFRVDGALQNLLHNQCRFLCIRLGSELKRIFTEFTWGLEAFCTFRAVNEHNVAS